MPTLQRNSRNSNSLPTNLVYKQDKASNGVFDKYRNVMLVIKNRQTLIVKCKIVEYYIIGEDIGYLELESKGNSTRYDVTHMALHEKRFMTSLAVVPKTVVPLRSYQKAKR